MARRIDDLGIENLKIIQDTDYFCFGMDSVLLANFVKSKSSDNIVVDLCSGSGVIPVIISGKKKCGKIFGIELQSEMFELLEENISLNKLEEKIIGINEDIKNVDKIRNYIKEKSNKDFVDIITCNPPYKLVGSGSINENNVKYIARHEAKCKLEDIFYTSSKLLKQKGELYLVHKPERLVDLFVLARKYHLEPKELTLVQPTIDKKSSIALIRYVKNGGEELTINKVIIEYNKNNEYTDEIYNIYGMRKK